MTTLFGLGNVDIQSKVCADRVMVDGVTANHFKKLLHNVNLGLTSGSTILNVKSNRAVDDQLSLGDKLKVEVHSMEKGISQIFQSNDFNEKLQAERFSKNDVGSASAVFYEYTKFGTQYYVATNFLGSAGKNFSEELAVFSRKS